jgi:hypothetical protein
MENSKSETRMRQVRMAGWCDEACKTGSVFPEPQRLGAWTWLDPWSHKGDIAECPALNYDSWLKVPKKPQDSMLIVGREVPAKGKSNDYLGLCNNQRGLRAKAYPYL